MLNHTAPMCWFWNIFFAFLNLVILEIFFLLFNCPFIFNYPFTKLSYIGSSIQHGNPPFLVKSVHVHYCDSPYAHISAEAFSIKLGVIYVRFIKKLLSSRQNWFALTKRNLPDSLLVTSRRSSESWISLLVHLTESYRSCLVTATAH